MVLRQRLVTHRRGWPSQHQPGTRLPWTEGRAWGPAFTLKGAEISEIRSCCRRAASSLLPNSLGKCRQEVWGGVSMPLRQDSCHRAEQPGRGRDSADGYTVPACGLLCPHGTREGLLFFPTDPLSSLPPNPPREESTGLECRQEPRPCSGLCTHSSHTRGTSAGLSLNPALPCGSRPSRSRGRLNSA